MSDLVKRLRERPSRYASETEGQAKERRQQDREEAADRIAQLEAALQRIDRMEVYEADAAVVLWAKIGIMRDIARAAVGEERT